MGKGSVDYVLVIKLQKTKESPNVVLYVYEKWIKIHMKYIWKRSDEKM